MNNTINTSPAFGASYNTYFYTTDGRRIVSQENMKKCLHYVEAQLNSSKRVKTPNKNLIETMKFGQITKDGQRFGGDKDYNAIPKIRAVFDRAKESVQGFITILTGKDAEYVSNTYGKPIGIAKKMSKEKIGSFNSFETFDATTRYANKAPEYASKKAVYKDGKKLAFGVCFTPIYAKKSGKLKGFEYHHAGFFNEELASKNV
jgi:hypothetical protein